MSSAFEGLPKTPNLKLNKPGYDNVADIEALNENADILDAEIQGIKNTFVKSVNGKEPDAGGNVNVEEYTHPNSGVTAGTYRSVTVNAQGHVTAGSNPTLAIANGGTGATTAEQARTNLGIKDIATYDVLPIVNGGTGATTASQARANLGIKDIAVEGTDYIVETYQNGTEWYRIWKSGWIEQGGAINITQLDKYENITVTLQKPMGNLNYHVSATSVYNDGQWAPTIGNKTTTSFMVNSIVCHVSNYKPTWYVCGQGA